MSAEIQLFDRRDDQAALTAIEAALIASGAEPTEVAGLVAKLRRRPLVRWFVLKNIREEIAAAGVATTAGQIDWEAIGDFLVKIAPIIFEILKMFL